MITEHQNGIAQVHENGLLRITKFEGFSEHTSRSLTFKGARVEAALRRMGRGYGGNVPMAPLEVTARYFAP